MKRVADFLRNVAFLGNTFRWIPSGAVPEGQAQGRCRLCKPHTRSAWGWRPSATWVSAARAVDPLIPLAPASRASVPASLGLCCPAPPPPPFGLFPALSLPLCFLASARPPCGELGMPLLRDSVHTRAHRGPGGGRGFLAAGPPLLQHPPGLGLEQRGCLLMGSSWPRERRPGPRLRCRPSRAAGWPRVALRGPCTGSRLGLSRAPSVLSPDTCPGSTVPQAQTSSLRTGPMCHVEYLVRNGGPEAMTTGSLQGKGPLQDLEDLRPWPQRLLPDTRLLAERGTASRSLRWSQSVCS